jgi:diguanylate cyclase (GGDEF)-like protein/PAS domain S-box-containing protein
MRKALVINVQAVQNDLYTVNKPLTDNIDFIVGNMIRLEESARICTTCHHAPPVYKRLINIQSLINKYGSALSRYLTGSANSERIEKLKVAAEEVGNSVLMLTKDMSHKASDNIVIITNITAQRLKYVRMILLFTLIATFSLSIVIAFKLIRFITTPVNEILKATRMITSGNYDAKVAYEDNTEFGEVARNFNAMSAAIQEGYEKIQGEMASRIKVEETLKKSEKFLNTIFDSIHDPFCIIDREYRIIKVNEAYTEMRKTTISSLIGRRCYEVLQEKNRVCEDCIVEKCFRSKDPCAKDKLLSFSDNTKIWLEIYTYPIVDREGSVTHVIEYSRDISGRKHAEEERKAAEERIVFNTLHDSLTDLPNRNLFYDYLRYAISRTKRHSDYLFAVLFLDIDRFKVFNDSMGHATGDEALLEISRRLKDSIRSEDKIARYGGDEFVILLEELKNEEEAVYIAERIQENIARQFDMKQFEILITASIGITFNTIGYEKPEDILRDADIAMYCAKNRGKGHIEIFNKKMFERTLAKIQLEANLRQAIKQNEFQLFYQPIISMKSGKIAGLEALIRWRHPVRGLISPLEFIPLAEETGLIIYIGEWVLDEACRQMKIWQEKYSEKSHLTISVNISSKQLFPNIIKLVGEAIEKYMLAPNTLVLEITESMLMENAAHVEPLLSKLKEMQVRIHIDDFGTGYSSLSYLHQFPIDALKIDRSFIKKADIGENYKIAKAIASLAHALNMEVVAEGIETEKQLAFVKSLGCEYVQGYLISKPVDSKAIEALLEQKEVFSELPDPFLLRT